MKKSFTMLELIVVIVVVGIISVMAIPRFERDNLQEAADQILSHIRYTQQLAMTDNKFDPSKKEWYKERWQIFFANTKQTNYIHSYTIFSDKVNPDVKVGFPNPNEIAKDPTNPSKLLTGGYSGAVNFDDPRVSKNLRIGETFGIKDIKFKGIGNATRITFDEIGRPYSAVQNAKNSTDKLLEKPCTITLSDDNDKNISIAVCNETGYAFILVENADEAKAKADKICKGEKVE